MFNFNQSRAATSKPHDEGSFQRVTVNLGGRLMLANHEEYDCIATEMSPGDVFLPHNRARPRIGERVIAYVDHVGRIEGLVSRLADGSFTVRINATERKRDKLAAQLTWIANKHELGLPEDRRHDRLAPRKTQTEITLEDGTRYACRIIDLSLSGAAVDTEYRFELGTPMLLGNMRGRIVRHFQEGVAIEFLGVQSRDTLREFL